MFEEEVAVYISFLLNSILSIIYAKKFLKEKISGKAAGILWILAHLIIQNLIYKLITNDIWSLLLQTIGFIVLESIFFRKEWSKIFFVAFSFMAGKEIIKYIISAVHTYFYDVLSIIMLNKIVEAETAYLLQSEQIMAIGSFVIIYVCIAISSLLLLVFLTIIARKFIWKDYKLSVYQNIFLILPCIAALCISITMKKMVIIVEDGFTFTIYDKVPETKFWIPVICLLLLGTIISSVILFQKLVQCMEEEKRRVLLENQVIQLHRETKEIQDIYGDMRGLKHDLNNHMNNIISFIKSRMGNESTELLGYIEGMERTVEKLDFTYKTGNAITDIIIHQKKQEADKEKIHFTADFFFPESLQIDVYDMSIILNNILENAIEACKKVEKGSIYIKSYVKGKLFFVESENDYKGELIFDKETCLPKSSKTDVNMHGIGLQNVKKCAQKYKGDIDISITYKNDKNSFVLVVMMCGNSSHPK